MGFKDTKITLCVFEPYECNAVKEYLEMMAEKGWMLQSISMSFFKFKKIEPRKIKYSVDTLHETSVFDIKDNDEVLEYRKGREAEGWSFICQANNKVQIFASEDEWKTDYIYNDPEKLFESISKASSYYIFNQLFIVIFFMISIYLQFFSKRLEFWISSNFSISAVIFIVPIILINFIEIIRFWYWYLKTKRNIKVNELNHYGSYKQLRIKNSIILLEGALFIITLIVCMILSDGIRLADILMILIPVIVMFIAYKLIGKLKVSIGCNIFMTTSIAIISFVIVTDIVISPMFNDYDSKDNKLADEINLTLMDFEIDKDSDDNHTFKEIQSSILAKRIYYSSTYGKNSLDYIILESEYPWIIELQKDRLIKEYKKYGSSIIERDMNLPDNIKIYSEDDFRRYIIISENKVIETTNYMDNVSEEEFINKVYKKLFE